MPLRFRLGFLGAWALFVVAAGLAALSAAAELGARKDARLLRRLDVINRTIAARLGPTARRLRGMADERGRHLIRLRSDVARAKVQIDESQDTDQAIIVSTAENRVVVRSRGETVFQAICSTGKGTTLVEEGRTTVFETPTGRFHIVSKEENPVWVPPDWHFIEEARKKKLGLVRLGPREAVDADTGALLPADDSAAEKPYGRALQRRLLKVEHNAVVEVAPDGTQRELPPGELITAGKSLVVPPISVRQRRFEKVLGHYRLNIGSGYALHGTLATDQLGRSVTHGCVRLADKDLEKLYAMAKVGDQVIIY